MTTWIQRNGLVSTPAQPETALIQVRKTGTTSYVQSEYKNPPKQKLAMAISIANSANIERNARTMRLFESVTNASLDDFVNELRRRSV